MTGVRTLVYYAAMQQAINILIEHESKGSAEPVSSHSQSRRISVNIQTLSTKFQAWRQYRASVRELSRLTDRELSDLGIGRADIEFIAKTGARA